MATKPSTNNPRSIEVMSGHEAVTAPKLFEVKAEKPDWQAPLRITRSPK